MSVSVGVLYGAQSLIRLVGTGRLTLSGFQSSFDTIYQVASAHEVLDMAQSCLWVRADTAGQLYLTEAGLRLADTADSGLALRIQLHEFVRIAQPSWAKKIPGGRSEAVRVFPSAVKQCFREAGLLEDWDESLIEWWDDLSRVVRLLHGDDKLRVGREAEGLSVQHEQGRTGRRPIWQSLESNYSGFDILSTVNNTSSDPLRIEVKGTYQPLADAYFVISRNEWNTAETTKSYVFHLWLLRRKPKTLIAVDYSQVEPHVPTDKGAGTWDLARIPFRSFSDASAC